MIKIQRNSKGFTLIELLIVIAIIGILAAIAIPSYTGYVKRAKVQEVVHAMGAVKTSVMAYYTESNSAPAGATDITTIKNVLGVEIPDKYLSGIVVQGGAITGVNGGGGTITATFVPAGAGAPKKAIGTGVDGGSLVLWPDASFRNWSWAKGGTLDDAYVPKN